MTNQGDLNPNKISPEDCYSLLELLDRLGKEGVAELVAKGKPRRITKGEMIYFLKSDINKLLAENPLEDPESVGIIVDDSVDGPGFVSQIVFKQSIIKRFKVGQEEEVYKDKVLDLHKAVLYGRSEGDIEDREILKTCGIVSSLHGKLYLDEDGNLLYENFGANKSKIRGPREKNYTVLEAEEIGVLMSSEMLEGLLEHPHTLTASIKIGFQLKPHFIIRIQATGKN